MDWDDKKKPSVQWVISQCLELCICIFTGVRLCVGGCVPALPMGGVFCRLSLLKVLSGGTVSDDKSDGKTARQAAILYSVLYPSSSLPRTSPTLFPSSSSQIPSSHSNLWSMGGSEM